MQVQRTHEKERDNGEANGAFVFDFFISNVRPGVVKVITAIVFLTKHNELIPSISQIAAVCQNVKARLCNKEEAPFSSNRQKRVYFQTKVYFFGETIFNYSYHLRHIQKHRQGNPPRPVPTSPVNSRRNIPIPPLTGNRFPDPGSHNRTYHRAGVAISTESWARVSNNTLGTASANPTSMIEPFHP